MFLQGFSKSENIKNLLKPDLTEDTEVYPRIARNEPIDNYASLYDIKP